MGKDKPSSSLQSGMSREEERRVKSAAQWDASHHLAQHQRVSPDFSHSQSPLQKARSKPGSCLVSACQDITSPRIGMPAKFRAGSFSRASSCSLQASIRSLRALLHAAHKSGASQTQHRVSASQNSRLLGRAYSPGRQDMFLQKPWAAAASDLFSVKADMLAEH